MCVDLSPPAQIPAVLHEAGPVERIDLEPVDSVEFTTLIDNVTDIFMPDQGPARRPGPGGCAAYRPSPVMTGGQALDALTAEHGFSMLVTVRKGASTHRVLFDAGPSPDGMVENMRRLDIDPGSIEAVVCSHGHYDHTTGLDGLIRAVGRANMPVLIHPDFWRRRRVLLPGIEPVEIPSVSRRALEDAGFDVLEAAQPSFVLGRLGARHRARCPGSPATSRASRRSRHGWTAAGSPTRWSWTTRPSSSTWPARGWSC